MLQLTLKPISLLLIAGLFALAVASVLPLIPPPPDVDINISFASQVEQTWPKAMVNGYAGSSVTWGQFRFDCGNGNISFKSWTDSVQLPGFCPKTNKGLGKAISRLIDEAERLGLKNTEMFREMKGWVAYIAQTFK